MNFGKFQVQGPNNQLVLPWVMHSAMSNCKVGWALMHWVLLNVASDSSVDGLMSPYGGIQCFSCFVYPVVECWKSCGSVLCTQLCSCTVNAVSANKLESKHGCVVSMSKESWHLCPVRQLQRPPWSLAVLITCETWQSAVALISIQWMALRHGSQHIRGLMPGTNIQSMKMGRVQTWKCGRCGTYLLGIGHTRQLSRPWSLAGAASRHRPHMAGFGILLQAAHASCIHSWVHWLS